MKILFFDDQRLGGRSNTRCVYGTPVKVGEYSTSACPGLPLIMRDKFDSFYRMYYTAQYIVKNNEKEEQVNCFCMAISTDCINLKKYENDLEFERKYYPEQLLPAGEIDEVLTALRDDKGMYRFFACKSDWGVTDEITVYMYVSSDGIHLEKQACNLNKNGAEPFAGSYYNHKKIAIHS